MMSCCSRGARWVLQSFRLSPAQVVRGLVIDAACSWREVEVVSVDATPPRSRIVTRVVHRGVQREFLGFNRARHAVLEAAILATRTHLIPSSEIEADLGRLQIIVDKTAGPREQEAMALLTAHVRDEARARRPPDERRTPWARFESPWKHRHGSISAFSICAATWAGASAESVPRFQLLRSASK